MEDGISKLGRARQELDAWLQVNEPKAASLGEGALKAEDVIVTSDALSAQAIQAQVHTTQSLCATVDSPNSLMLLLCSKCVYVLYSEAFSCMAFAVSEVFNKPLHVALE